MQGFRFILAISILAYCLSEAKGQSLPAGDNDCRADGIFYTQDGINYNVNEATNNCRLSYVWSPNYRSQILSLSFSNVVIVCNGLNQLKIIDNNNNIYDYCALNKPRNFFFGTYASEYTTLIKRGVVRFQLRYSFLSTGQVTVAPITVAPVTVAPITVAPITVAPVTIAPVTVAPITVAPITIAPVTVAPTTTVILTTPTTTAAPVTVAPVTVAPITIAPVTVAPTTTVTITIPTTTAAPVTVAPVTAATSSCGVANPLYPPNLSGLTRIVGGIEANQHSFPWQVYITDNNYICGASLINNQWLVTAAHCNFQLSTFEAYLGDHFIGRGNTRIRVQSFIPHPSYSTDQNYDIALIKLQTPVAFSSTIQPVCLPNGKTESLGNTGIVTGWGDTTENGNLANGLRQVSISVQQDSVCINSGIFNFNAAISICAGETTPVIHDSCQGDSGGPFVMRDSVTNAFYLAGVVSSGVGCRGKGVYMRVSAFESWIASTIANN